MHIVALLSEALNGAAHGDDGILGLRAEHEAAFRIRTGALGTVGVVLVGLATGPASDCMLHLIKDADV